MATVTQHIPSPTEYIGELTIEWLNGSARGGNSVNYECSSRSLVSHLTNSPSQKVKVDDLDVVLAGIEMSRDGWQRS
jgi:hypothetical protein